MILASILTCIYAQFIAFGIMTEHSNIFIKMLVFAAFVFIDLPTILHWIYIFQESMHRLNR